MKLSEEMKASIQTQREAGYPTYNFFTTTYPFSLIRLTLILLLAGAIALICYLILAALANVLKDSSNTVLSVIAVIGGFFGLPTLALIGIVGGLFMRIRGTLTINLFREAVELIDDPFPYALRRRRYLLTSAIAEVSQHTDHGGRWVVVRMASGEDIPLLVRTSYDDEDSARTILETVRDNCALLQRKSQSADAPDWKRRLAECATYEEYRSLDEHERLTLLRGLLEDLGGAYPGAKLTEDADSFQVQLRLKHQGAAVRIILSAFDDPVLQSKPGIAGGRLELSTCAEEDIPVARDASDPWAEDDLQRVFVGHGVYAEDGDSGDTNVKDSLALLAVLPRDLADTLLRGLEGNTNPVVKLSVDKNGFRAETFGIYHLDDPVPELRAAVEYLAGLAGALSAVRPGQVKKGAIIYEFTRCAYCGSRYPVDMKAHCPNCGSPPGASA